MDGPGSISISRQIVTHFTRYKCRMYPHLRIRGEMSDREIGTPYLLLITAQILDFAPLFNNRKPIHPPSCLAPFDL